MAKSNGTSACENTMVRAFENALISIDLAKSLPAQVYRGAWSSFLFFDADRILAPEFVEVVHELLKAETAKSCCLVNITRTSAFEYKNAAMIQFDDTISPASYAALLREDNEGLGWIYTKDRYSCASDKGRWCIYSETQNDVAIIGLRNRDETLNPGLKKLHAQTIDIITDRATGIFPYFALTEEWRRGLFQHYRSGTEGSEAKL
ncbi:hypothetical protein [Reyranella sp.]|uniref:hypothetical protein n=1 Tax=Reyranella sp. TaxID=1929291 RepID=UPI0037852658